jgi:hypothetical protein
VSISTLAMLWRAAACRRPVMGWGWVGIQGAQSGGHG